MVALLGGYTSAYSRSKISVHNGAGEGIDWRVDANPIQALRY